MKPTFTFVILTTFILTACSPVTATVAPVTAVPTTPPTETPGAVIYTDPSQPVDARVEDLLKHMTLDEKIGQMTQVEKNSIQPGDITKYFIGSILSGGGGSPEGNNTPEGWYAMVEGFQKEALATRLKIPIIYGVDAVHGHGNLLNATVFPHNIGLGAANDPGLMEKIGRATAEEMLATGINWNFAPCVAVAQDVRWGRTYESYSESTAIVTSLSEAYIKSLQGLTEVDASVPGQSILVLATSKHYLGDGGTIWSSSRTDNYKIDQGNMQVPEEVVRKLFLPPYEAAVDAGALNVMASFSSWRGTKMHAQKYLLTNVLKEELGFKGFIVSDWQAIDQIDADYYNAVVTAINAGIDMNMVPYDYVNFIETMKQAVNNGDITEERVDEAVRRILRVKFALGMFERPMPEAKYQGTVRSREHLELARQAVRESLVLLKNEKNILPLSKDTPLIFVAGEGANDIGLQSGGWTLQWQGQPGNDNEGTTIFSGIKATVGPNTHVEFDRTGVFDELKNADGNLLTADVGILVLAEQPYAEGVGDSADISLTQAESDLISQMRKRSKILVVILLSGRPRVITEQLLLADAWVAAWLPGTEGGGVADVLFGDYPFTGKLPFSWPRSNEQLPININNSVGKTGCDAPLFPFGYGLAFGENMPEIPECP